MGYKDNGKHCICRQRHQEGTYMVRCHRCGERYHSKCLNDWAVARPILARHAQNGTDHIPQFTEDMLSALEEFVCPKCMVRNRYDHYAFPGMPKKVCARVDCGKTAGPNSKYCSHRCGLVNAVQCVDSLLRELKKVGAAAGPEKSERLTAVVGGVRDSQSEARELSRLESLQAERDVIGRDLAALETQSALHEKAIALAEGLTGQTQPTSTVPAKHFGEMDCMVCGQSTPVKSYARHIHFCAAKIEELRVPRTHLLVQPYLHPSLQPLYCNHLDRKANGPCRRLKDSCALHSHDRRKLLRALQPCGYPLVANSNVWPVPTTWDMSSDWPVCTNHSCSWHQAWPMIWKDRIVQETFILKTRLAANQLEEEQIYLWFGRTHNPFTFWCAEVSQSEPDASTAISESESDSSTEDSQSEQDLPTLDIQSKPGSQAPASQWERDMVVEAATTNQAQASTGSQSLPTTGDTEFQEITKTLTNGNS